VPGVLRKVAESFTWLQLEDEFCAPFPSDFCFLVSSTCASVNERLMVLPRGVFTLMVLAFFGRFLCVVVFLVVV
jgi:hypothetical protein